MLSLFKVWYLCISLVLDELNLALKRSRLNSVFDQGQVLKIAILCNVALAFVIATALEEDKRGSSACNLSL